MSETFIRITRVIAPGEFANEIKPPMQRLGNAIGRRAQRVVPKRSWRLHDSIGTSTEVVDGKVITHVYEGGREIRGKQVNYGLNVERGTSRMMAQPFMRPALYQSKTGDLNFTGTLDDPKGS
jgi:hypothetical protein